MGTFRTNCEVRGIRSRTKPVLVRDLLVDTGSGFSWLPAADLREAGVRIVKKDQFFVLANGEQVSRSTGYAILSVDSFEIVDEVVFGLEGDLSLLGARTLEGFGATVVRGLSDSGRRAHLCFERFGDCHGARGTGQS